MVAFSTVKAGDTLWSVGRVKAGNTNMSVTRAWPVYVVSVDPETKTAQCRWNNNRERKYTELMLKRLRRTKPEKAQ